MKAIKVRLYPNKIQEEYINKLLGSYRYIYNNCLQKRKNVYLKTGKSFGLKDMGNYFHQELLKNEELSWLKEHNTKVLKQSIIDLLDSYKRFFVNGNGFPKFKSKHNNKLSCRFPVDAISRRNDYSKRKLTLTKQLKDIKFRCSKKYIKILSENKTLIKSATLTKTKSNNYYLSILMDIPTVKELPQTDKVVGIDLGIKDFVITSDAQVFENIKIKRSNEKKLGRLHKRLSRKKKGSKNRNKVRIKLAKYYERLNNIKENYLHSVSNTLLNENQVIVMEDLNVSGMMKNGRLSKSIQELSLNRFKNILEYKCRWYNRDLVVIDRFYPSSKLCNNCGSKKGDLKLSDRIYKCNSCNVHIDRDLNASLNIRDEGIRILKDTIPIRSGELTPLESSC